MAKKNGKGSLIYTAPPTAPGQDGFNHPSHVTTYGDAGFQEEFNMVGNCADTEQDMDHRGKYRGGKK